MSIPHDESQPGDVHSDLHPAMRDVIAKEGLKAEETYVALPIDEADKPSISDHHVVHLSDGEKAAVWQVPSLRALFRGDKVPPSFADGPDEAYAHLFFDVERHALLYCQAAGDKTDGEFEEAYNNLRRRPDGKPLSPLQAYLWQVAAWLAGVHQLSAAEFDAIFGRLARSARNWRDGFSSRNYVDLLHQSMDRFDNN